jgi:ferredoxin
LLVDAAAKTHRRLPERCVGCGQCVLACTPRALTMEPTPDYRPPYRNWFSMIAHMVPKFLSTSWHVRNQRR